MLSSSLHEAQSCLLSQHIFLLVLFYILPFIDIQKNWKNFKTFSFFVFPPNTQSGDAREMLAKILVASEERLFARKDEKKNWNSFESTFNGMENP